MSLFFVLFCVLIKIKGSKRAKSTKGSVQVEKKLEMTGNFKHIYCINVVIAYMKLYHVYLRKLLFQYLLETEISWMMLGGVLSTYGYYINIRN